MEQEVIQVQLRAAGEIKYFFTGGMKFNIGDKVIVEADRGLEYGEVFGINKKLSEIGTVEEGPIRKIIRKANPWDEEQIEKNKAKTKELMNVCEKKIAEHKLPMKLLRVF